jgi:hypothetical protein
LLCDDPPKDEGGRGIGVTMVWDFPKGAIALDKLEATVWIQFLVFPNGPKTGQNGTRTWNVESRKLRFTLKGEDWIKE